jgi:hypothetical protein
VAPPPKWLRIALYVVVGSFLFYVLAANVILRTHLLRGWINAHEDKLRVEYASAWSAYPGHVVVRDFSLRYQDSNIQMLILLDRATIRFDPFALPKRTMRVSKLDADGATFRMRHKVESIEGSEGRVSAFPPIEGFADPPVEKKVEQPPIPDDQYRLWTIDLDDVTASLREVWTMEYRYRGAGSLTGGFHLRPKRELWVSPSVMLTDGGVLSLGDRELIRGGTGRLEAHVDPFDVREFKGVEALRNMSARVHQRGEMMLPAIAATYFPKGAELAVTQGSGPVAVDVDIEHGVVRPDSRVSFHTDDAIMKVAFATVHTDADFVAHVEKHGETSALVAETAIAHAVLTPALDVRDAHARLETSTADLSVPFELARLSGAVISAHARDLRAWHPIAPENTTFVGGAATFAARADYRGGAFEGRLDALLDKARMTIGTFGFECSGKAWGNVTSDDVEKSVGFPGSGVDLRGVALRLQDGHAEGLWMRARSETAGAKTSSPFAFDTDIAVESGPGDRTLELFTRLASLPDLAADATAGSRLTASLHLRVRHDDVSLTVTDAKNGILEGRGRVRKREGEAMTGAFVLSAGPLRTGLDLHDGKVSVAPFRGGGWLEEKLQER